MVIIGNGKYRKSKEINFRKKQLKLLVLNELRIFFFTTNNDL